MAPDAPTNHTRAVIWFGVLFSLPLLAWSTVDLTSADANDAYLTMLGLPLFLWMGGPWKLRFTAQTISRLGVATCGVGILVGLASGLTIVFAVAWTRLLWILLQAFVQPDPQRSLSRLMLIPLFSFPWIILDGQSLGWSFRVSGAWAAEHLLGAAGFDVTRNATILFVENLRISVGEGCAGVSTLQSMLLGGSILAYSMLHSHRRFWWHVPILVAAAWLANTARVAMTGAVALAWGPSFAEGAYHEWEGLAVLIIMFILAAGAFAVLGADNKRPIVETETATS